MRAVVIGAGVAGPACALALSRIGWEVTILERRPRIDPEEGSFLTVAPNGLDALENLGCLPAVRAVSVSTRWNDIYSSTGQWIGRLALGADRPDGSRALTLRRSALAAELTAKASQIAQVRFDATITAIESNDDASHVTLADGTQLACDLIVGADGVHSMVRGHLNPAGPAPLYLGLTNFGGFTPDPNAAAELTPQAWHFIFGAQAFFGAHPTPTGVAWFANIPEPEISREQRATTSREVWHQHVLEHLRCDSGPAADLVTHGTLDLAGDNTYDLKHIPAWRQGRIVLAGDAAHTPSPSSGQGASIALEDAVLMAQALRDRPDIDDALTVYERHRRPRTERIVKAAARTSSTKIPGPFGRRIRDAGLRVALRHMVTERSTTWMTGYTNPWTSTIE